MRSSRRIISFNAQGYYDPVTWTSKDYPVYGFFRKQHTRRVGCDVWVQRAVASAQLLRGVSVWLAQECPPSLFAEVQKEFHFASARQSVGLPQFQQNGSPLTTDILFDPEAFKILDCVEIPPSPDTQFERCHINLLALMMERATNTRVTMGSLHYEAGVSAQAQRKRVEQHNRTLLHEWVRDQPNVILAGDSNDSFKPDSATGQTDMTQSFLDNGFDELVNNRQTFRPEDFELPFGQLFTKIFGLTNSYDRFAAKGRNMVVTSFDIHNPTNLLSDHNALCAQVVFGSVLEREHIEIPVKSQFNELQLV